MTDRTKDLKLCTCTTDAEIGLCQTPCNRDAPVATPSSNHETRFKIMVRFDENKVSAPHLLQAIVAVPGVTFERMVAIATPDETSGWQPIETAPLEGAHVLVVDSGEVSEARHIEGHGWYLAQNDPTDSWGPGPLNPTHWMQLPCPPGTRPRPSSSVEPTPPHPGPSIAKAFANSPRRVSEKAEQPLSSARSTARDRDRWFDGKPEKASALTVICCPECGGDDIAAGDQKANGTERKCRECNHQFLR